MTVDYLVLFNFVVLGCWTVFFVIRFSPQCWHIALSNSDSLPAQRDGKFTVGLTQILFTGVFAF